MIINPYPRYMRSGGDIMSIGLRGLLCYSVRQDYRKLRSLGVTADDARMFVWGLLNAGIYAERVDTRVNPS
jgi:hypothetical protein